MILIFWKRIVWLDSLQNRVSKYNLANSPKSGKVTIFHFLPSLSRFGDCFEPNKQADSKKLWGKSMFVCCVYSSLTLLFFQVSNAVDHVNLGNNALLKAKKKQKSSRKWTCIAILILLIIIIIALVSVFKPWTSKDGA